MYPSDAKTRWPGNALTDPRFVHGWDDTKAIGRHLFTHRAALPRQPSGAPPRTDVDVLWDAYLLFDEKATWTGPMPDRLVSWGSTIMQARERLIKDVRTLTESRATAR
jgi:hypothetical protein